MSDLTRNFSIAELSSPDQPGSGINMDKQFMSKVQLLRDFVNMPLLVNSGFRSVKHNKLIGGSIDSSHLTGLAIDLKCNDSRLRFLLLQGAIMIGFNRIGIGWNFIHLDDDLNKVSKVIWLY